MKAFLLSIVAAIVIAVGTAAALKTIDVPTSQKYATSNVRL